MEGDQTLANGGSFIVFSELPSPRQDEWRRRGHGSGHGPCVVHESSTTHFLIHDVRFKSRLT